MVVVEISPEVVLSSLGLGPVPGLLNRDSGSVHVVHVVTVRESGKLGVSSESILAHASSSDVAIDFEASHWVSESDDASSPAFIEGVVGVIVRSEDRVEGVPGSVQLQRVNDTGHWQDFSAGGITFVRVASIAGHPTHKAVFLFRPDSRLEG